MTPSASHAVETAHNAFGASSTSTPAQRAAWLRAAAHALDEHGDDLIALAQEESHLPAPRLTGELFRTVFQARLFADRLDEGALTPPRLDEADPQWPMGPRPRLDRRYVPLGPVVVFAASNFPFAFSVFGGDTVSALAVGCSVILKVHPGHPRLSEAVARLVSEAMTGAGAPTGLLTTISDDEDGVTVLKDRRVKAGAFTGSTRVGRILLDHANSREEPIPFYGELGATNPVAVTPAAWATRSAAIVEGFAASFTLGSGQFCTKPGVLLVPDAQQVLDSVGTPGVGEMLNPRIRSGYEAAADDIAARAGVARHTLSPANESLPAVELFVTDTAAVLADPAIVMEEVFGPAAMIVEYSGVEELYSVLQQFGGSLTATIHADEDDDPDARGLVQALTAIAGRVVWNAWPTGVTVSDAQQHGGPWPASTAPSTTSVGTAAAYRFVRPVALQDVPAWAL